MTNDPLALLRRSREADAPSNEERCQLCTEPIAEQHGHVADLQSRVLLCACRGCYLLFTSEGAGGRHYRAVPERYVALSTTALSPGQWDALEIPVGMAFFLVNSTLNQVAAFYPGPAGATESLLQLDSWGELVAALPGLDALCPDVEALLVWAPTSRSSPECFIVPIDACYALVGELRRLWRGFDGGREATGAIEAFFDQVRMRAQGTSPG